MINIRLVILTIAFLAAKITFAQQEKSFDFSLVPTLGFNVSYSTFQKGYKKDYYIIDRNISMKDFYYGIGIQVQYLTDFQFTIRYAGGAIGAGYRFKTLYYSSGMYENNFSQTSSSVNMLDATTEKKLFDIRFLQKRNYPMRLAIGAMVGMRYISIVKPNRTDSLYPLPNVSVSPMIQSKGFEKQYRNGGACISAGLNAQLFVKDHRSLKLGVLYNYLLRPIYEYQFHVKTTTYQDGRYQTYQDDFNLFVGRHQVLFYIEYPIKLFKIKY